MDPRRPSSEGNTAAEKDANLAERFAAGDRRAFGELFDAFYPRVRGLARRLIGSDAAAEDVASEVFLRARRSCGSFDPARPVAGWLLGITAHLCLDSIRRRQVEQRVFEAGREVETLPADSSPGPLTLALFAERKAEVRAAIDRLPERLRTPLVLRYFAEMTYDEIAGRLGKCRAEVASLIFGAKQMLRRELNASQEER